MKPSEWGTFGAFIALLFGLSLLNARLATIAGLGAIGLVFIHYLNGKQSSPSVQVTV